MNTESTLPEQQESTDESFTRDELMKARDAGASYQFLKVAKEYPESTAGRELRRFLDWDKLNKFTLMAGGFASALWKWNYDGQIAYGCADMRNSQILKNLFGEYE